MIFPVLDLSEYRLIVQNLPQPTLIQMKNFANFVARAHSWYKHLPLFPPGVRFHFFVDPCAGMQRIVSADGVVKVLPRGQQGFHYSWIPTRDYRQRFGYLAFYRPVGTSVSLLSSNGTSRIEADDVPAIYVPEKEKMYHLPGQVLEAGHSFISGVIHGYGAHPQLLLREFAVHKRKPPPWPEESGGVSTLRKILARCQELAKDPSCKQTSKIEDLHPDEDSSLVFVDNALSKLLELERNRQKSLMIGAMGKMVKLLYKW